MKLLIFVTAMIILAIIASVLPVTMSLIWYKQTEMLHDISEMCTWMAFIAFIAFLLFMTRNLTEYWKDTSK